MNEHRNDTDGADRPSDGFGAGVPEVYAASERPPARAADPAALGPGSTPGSATQGPSLWWGSPSAGPALLRAATRAERRLSLVCAAAVAGVFGLATVVINRDRLVAGVLAATVIVLAAVLAVLVGWWRRVEFPSGPRFYTLERPRRRALRRELLAGRPGDFRDRDWARFWVGRRLRYPANSATQLGVAGWYVGLAPTLTLTHWGVLLAWCVLAATGAVPLALRPRWLRLAERLDHESEHTRS